MRRLAAIAVLPLLAAAPQADPDAYTCSADAFSIIGGIYGEGRGAVSLRLDPAYRPTEATISYTVIERIARYAKLAVGWTVPPGGGLDAATGPGSVRIPLATNLPDAFTATVSLDGAVVATHRFQRRDGKVIDLDATGWVARGDRQPAIVSGADHPWLPDLRGRATIAYSLTADGRSIGGELFLLPDWKALRGKIRAALREADGLRKRRRCDRTFFITPVE